MKLIVIATAVFVTSIIIGFILVSKNRNIDEKRNRAFAVCVMIALVSSMFAINKIFDL